MVEQPDQIPAERIIILALEVRADLVVKITEAQGCLADVVVRTDFADLVELLLIVLVTDLADDLLENILHRDDADHHAVFVEHDRHRDARLAHLQKQLVRVLELVGEIRLPHIVADVEGLLVIVEQNVFHVQHADDVVRIVLIDRQPRELLA